MDLKNKTINFLGDSITEGYGASAQDKRYSDVFSEIAEIKEVRNYGISGTRIARQQKINPQTVEWDTNSFCERYDKMEDADIIVVFGGTNDYDHGDAPFGKFEDDTPDTFCGALHFLMKGLMEKFPTAEIVFLTPMHRENEEKPNASDGLPLYAYIEMIRKTAEYYSLPILDLYSSLGINPNIKVHKELFCPDGLHPNDTGYRKIAERIKGFLESL